jgi:hypothetical protein
MRYAPAERLLRLARHLAATRIGLTLDEMAAELEIGRRTAERLRDSLMAMFPQMECWDDEDRVRRWRLPGSALVGVVELRAEAWQRSKARRGSVRCKAIRTGRRCSGGIDDPPGDDAA